MNKLFRKHLSPFGRGFSSSEQFIKLSFFSLSCSRRGPFLLFPSGSKCKMKLCEFKYFQYTTPDVVSVINLFITPERLLFREKGNDLEDLSTNDFNRNRSGTSLCRSTRMLMTPHFSYLIDFLLVFFFLIRCCGMKERESNKKL